MRKIASVLLAVVVVMISLMPVSAYAKTITNDEGTLSISTTYLQLPTMVKKDASFRMSGKVVASNDLALIKISIEDLNQFTSVTRCRKVITGNKVDLSNYSKYLQIEKLSSGVKRLNILFKDVNGNKVVLQREFTILGKAAEPKHITDKCNITVTNGNARNVTDNSDSTMWNSGKMTIKLPKNKVADGILIKWYNSTGNHYTVKSYNSDNELLDEYDGKDYYFVHQYFYLNEDAVKVVIDQKTNTNNGRGMVGLRVYEKDKVGISVERWERPLAGHCDLMVISCHRDDELLYFGGTIPYYQNVKGKTVYTMYMSGNDRLRIREALAGQWSMGVKTYPIIGGFEGGYHNGVEGTLAAWGGEQACLKKLVEKIRRYKPYVIVTHDVNGEYGHPSHKTTSYLVTKAVRLANDKTKFPDSYKEWGLWSVQKVYKHYTKQNVIKMNWNTHYDTLNGKSPFQVATIAFDKHTSQHANWSMTCDAVKKCPNNEFGLVYTKVGPDYKKNDFFENID